MKSRKREVLRKKQNYFYEEFIPCGDLDTCADLGERGSMLLSSSEGSYLC